MTSPDTGTMTFDVVAYYNNGGSPGDLITAGSTR